MTSYTIKGYTIVGQTVKDSFNRRAQHFSNALAVTLGKLGLSDYQFEISQEMVAMKKTPASVSWGVDGHYLYYSFGGAGNHAENMYVVSKVVELEVDAFLSGKKTQEEFIASFAEDHDIAEQRKEARATLGLHHDTKDMEAITKKYKQLAKEHHPDTATGNLEKFKLINHAHKTLKRELE